MGAHSEPIWSCCMATNLTLYLEYCCSGSMAIASATSKAKVACSLHATWVFAASYGDRAEDITRIAEQRKLGRRLVRGYPVLEAEVVYAVHNEYCETPEDFIARRSRLAFLDTRACAEALPRVRSPPCSTCLQRPQAIQFLIAMLCLL